MNPAIFTAVLSLGLMAQVPQGSPSQGTEHQHAAQQEQSQQHCEMMKRGDQAMGFSQDRTTHHFYLEKDGGTIDVSVKDPKDAESREAIRQHLSHIAGLFASGNFDAPMFIHGTTPPGVSTLKRLHEQIRYEYQQTESGGRVRIGTANPQALDAIHAFLLFQIVDHETGDSPAIQGGADKK